MWQKKKYSMRLNRFILTASLAVAFAFAGVSPVAATAAENAPSVSAFEETVSGAKITVSASTGSSQDVRVQDAEGQRLEIYNVIGVKVASLRIDSNDKTFTLGLQRGCYILKVGKVVRKTFIR